MVGNGGRRGNDGGWGGGWSNGLLGTSVTDGFNSGGESGGGVGGWDFTRGDDNGGWFSDSDNVFTTGVLVRTGGEGDGGGFRAVSGVFGNDNVGGDDGSVTWDNGGVGVAGQSDGGEGRSSNNLGEHSE